MDGHLMVDQHELLGRFWSDFELIPCPEGEQMLVEVIGCGPYDGVRKRVEYMINTGEHIVVVLSFGHRYLLVNQDFVKVLD